jgi:hypothetical protein
MIEGIEDEITKSMSIKFSNSTYGEGPMQKKKVCDTILDCVGGTPICRLDIDLTFRFLFTCMINITYKYHFSISK